MKACLLKEKFLTTQKQNKMKTENIKEELITSSSYW